MNGVRTIIMIGHRASPAGNRGAGLLEVLIAMLILAVGVLAIAALQFRGMQYNQDALFRSQISLLAYDLADRMRLNRDNANDYVTNVGNWTVPTTRQSCTILSAADATRDVACWKNQVIDNLPEGSRVALSGSNPYSLTLEWTDRDGTSRSANYVFQL